MPLRRWRLPWWAPLAALALSLLFAWVNFLTTGRWAELPGALHGWRKPWYAAALVILTLIAGLTRRRIGAAVTLDRRIGAACVGAGAICMRNSTASDPAATPSASAVRRALPLIVALAYGGLVRAPILLVAAIALVLPFHFVSHKEFRFLVPALPVLLMVLGHKVPPPPAPYERWLEYSRPVEYVYRRPGGCVTADEFRVKPVGIPGT